MRERSVVDTPWTCSGGPVVDIPWTCSGGPVVDLSVDTPDMDGSQLRGRYAKDTPDSALSSAGIEDLGKELEKQGLLKKED